jgi:ArsR family transcriptional regulator
MTEITTQASTVERTGAADRGGEVTCCGGATEWLPRDRAESIAAALAAVADPVRLQVLSIIAHAPTGEVCACDFVGPLGKSQPTVSHHLKVLSEAGLVDGDKRGRWVWYRLVPGHLDALVAALRSATAAG